MGCCNSKTKEAPKTKPVEVVPKPKDVGEKTIVEEKPKADEQDPRLARIHKIQEARKGPFCFNKCTEKDGVVTPLIQNGFIYRIVKGDTWYIYNDSIEYEAHVEHYFNPESQISPGERTSIQVMEDGSVHSQIVVYPLETLLYVTGTHEGYRGNVVAKALSEAYLGYYCGDANDLAARELDAAKNVAGDDTDDEKVLEHCMKTKTPFVDINFPPSPRMLYRPEVDGHALHIMAMKRPSQYLPSEAHASVGTFVGPVVPHAIEPGYLGDCWFTCAAAVLAEKETAVKSIFLNTQDAECKLGAFRVLLNKNGWWREVIVDNYLPTIANMPTFARSEDPRELWVPLLQKAYAKMHGSYAAITGGDALQALQDFTGAPVQRFDNEWKEAAASPSAAQEFFAKLAHVFEAQCLVVLSTPSHNQVSDPALLKGKFEAAGLQLSYTYHLERVVSILIEGREVVLLKVCNPWNSKGRWTGWWSPGSSCWKKYPAAAEACDCVPEDMTYQEDGTFWIAFDDAVEYFNGGGIVFTPKELMDYRVKGTFRGVEPSVVLKITATEPVEVLLMLSQQDKRGLPTSDAAARFAPLMLSVAKHGEDKYSVDRNSGLDVALPGTDYTFAVARDVALRYTFEPSDKPYLVVPRIHSKGVVDGYDRPFVLSVLSSGPVDDVLNIEFSHIKADNRVFQNLRTFVVGDLPGVDAEYQKHLPGELLVSAISNCACGVPTVETSEVLVITSTEANSALPNEIVKEEIDFKVDRDDTFPNLNTEVQKMS